MFSYRFRKDLDARWEAKPTDDLYSLGVAFYRCVTGLYLTPLSEGGEVASSREVVRPTAYATDRPTEPSSSTDSTRVRRRRRRQAVVPDWAAPALAALASGFLVALVMIVSSLLSRTSEPAPRLEEPPRDVAQFAPGCRRGPRTSHDGRRRRGSSPEMAAAAWRRSLADDGAPPQTTPRQVFTCPAAA